MKLPQSLSIVILAAGKGTRMKSDQAKVLHEVFYKPMIHHVLDTAETLQPQRSVVIVGHQEEAVRKSLAGYDITVVQQKDQLGTGHAVQMCDSTLTDDEGLIMILYGDCPLIQKDSLLNMFEQHNKTQSDITVMTTLLDKPKGYGRIIAEGKKISAIVEEKDANNEQKQIQEVNAGIYLVKRKLLFEALNNITPQNSQGEFYLTDIVEYSVSLGLIVQKFTNLNPAEVLGVNSRMDLEAAHTEFQKRRNFELMQQGVSMHNSNTISVSLNSTIKPDTLLMQNVQIVGKCVIGTSCTLENGVILKNCRIGNNVHIGAYSVLVDQQIDADSELAPYTSLS